MIFFATDFLRRNEIKLSVSFLDGMHLVEFLLRDFINTERNSHPDGIIIMHDCCPRDIAMTTRDFETLPLHAGWTGDVWKLLPILQRYRPDLKLTMLDSATTGLLLITNLAPENDTLSRNYNVILESYKDISLDDFGVENFYASFTYTDTKVFLDGGAQLFAPVALAPETALKPTFITP
jgi:hypothetical protein